MMNQEEMVDGRDTQARLRKVNLVLGKSKNDPICSNTIVLSKERPSTFGRVTSPDVNVRLLSRVTPLMISRKHATVAFSAGQWSITDHSSLNGVYVNGNRIRPNEAHPVSNGDKIGFGCAVASHTVSEFEYVFELVPSPRLGKRPSQSISSHKLGTECKKRKILEPQDSLGGSSSVIEDFENVFSVQSGVVCSFDNRIKIEEERIRQLKEQVQEKERQYDEMRQKLEEKEKDLAEKLEKQARELEQEKQEAENKLQQLLEEQLKDKETKLKGEFDEQIRILQNERNKVEENLQKELRERLSEKDQTHREELERQKEALDRMLREKEADRTNLEQELLQKQELLNNLKNAEENEKKLETCLDELKKQIQDKNSELQKQKEITTKAEEAAKRTVIEQMEDEFTCIICQELFVNSVTLSCSHSFCEICLTSWMRKKKNCPVCRRRVKGKAVRSIVLDNAVLKILEGMDDDTKARREDLVQERQRQKDSERGTADAVSVPDEDSSDDDLPDVQITYTRDNHAANNPNAPGPSRAGGHQPAGPPIIPRAIRAGHVVPGNVAIQRPNFNPNNNFQVVYNQGQGRVVHGNQRNWNQQGQGGGYGNNGGRRPQSGGNNGRHHGGGNGNHAGGRPRPPNHCEICGMGHRPWQCPWRNVP